MISLIISPIHQKKKYYSLSFFSLNLERRSRRKMIILQNKVHNEIKLINICILYAIVVKVVVLFINKSDPIEEKEKKLNKQSYY
jgi:hypothetical protein